MVDDLDTLIAVECGDGAFAGAYEDAQRRSAILRDLVGARRARGIAQRMVAERMGTTQSAVSDLECGATDPRLSTLQRYARAVGMRLVVEVEQVGSDPSSDPGPVPAV